MSTIFTPNGPSGGFGGIQFYDATYPPDWEIHEVSIYSGDLIDSIQVTYLDQFGVHHVMSRHGGNGGVHHAPIKLKPGEYIKAIGGRYGDMVDQLWIQTSTKAVYKYGGPGGSTDFIYEAPPGSRIIGFWGRSGSLVDAIGALMRTP